MPTEAALTSISSYDDLLRLLDQQGVAHQADASSKSVQIQTERKGISGVQLIRWQDEDGVLQFIQMMLSEIPDARIAAVESAIAHLNHAMAWPGLDLNHQYHMLAFRLVLPIMPRGSLAPQEIQAGFELALKSATDFYPTLKRVISGETATADALADAQRELSGNSSPAAAEKPSPPATPPPSVFRVD